MLAAEGIPMGLESQRNISPELAETDRRLHAWGAWCRVRRAEGDWPPVSLTGKMVEAKKLGIMPDASYRLPEPPSPDVLEVEEIVVHMANEAWRRVIKRNYTSSEPREVKARHEDMSLRRWDQLLQWARVWVTAKLHGA